MPMAPFAHKSARRIPVSPAGWMDGRHGMPSLIRNHGRCWEAHCQKKNTPASLAAPRAEEVVDNGAMLKSRPRGRGTGLPMASLDEQPWDMLQQKQKKQ